MNEYSNNDNETVRRGVQFPSALKNEVSFSTKDDILDEKSIIVDTVEGK